MAKFCLLINASTFLEGIIFHIEIHYPTWWPCKITDAFSIEIAELNETSIAFT